jgi:hypothetical protein
MLCNVVLEITGDGSHVWRDDSSRWIVIDNLIASEVQQGVGIVLESLHNGECSIQVRGIIGGPRHAAVNAFACQRRVNINQHVNANRIEDRSTQVMVEIRIDIVNSNSIDAQPLHQSSVSQADISIAQGIRSRRRVIT